MDVILLATCTTCPGVRALKDAAKAEGYTVRVESVRGSDDRTLKSALLGIGLPVLVREDGALSDDGKVWQGADGPIKKTRKKKTNPITDVVEPVETEVGSDAGFDFA